MAYDTIEVDGGDRTTITLDRPKKLNAMTAAMFAELRTAIDGLEDPSVVTIRGAAGSFSAGVDVSAVPEWAADRPLAVRDRLESVHALLGAIEDLDVPVVAAVEGHCLGGGLELAVACDLRVSSADATYGLPEANLGLAMDLGGAQKLPGLIGEGATKHLIMTGTPIDAARAYELGLVQELADEGAFEEAVDSLEDRLAEQPTYVLGLAKRQIHSVRPPQLEESMQTAIHHAISAYREEETLERVGRFLDEDG